MRLKLSIVFLLRSISGSNHIKGNILKREGHKLSKWVTTRRCAWYDISCISFVGKRNRWIESFLVRGELTHTHSRKLYVWNGRVVFAVSRELRTCFLLLLLLSLRLSNFLWQWNKKIRVLLVLLKLVVSLVFCTNIKERKWTIKLKLKRRWYWRSITFAVIHLFRRYLG